MKLVLNEIDPEDVRYEEFQGRDFLVAPVTPIKAMELDGGYVPTDHVVRSAPAWNGTPVTLNHPRDENGQLVSANSPEIAQKTWMGYTFNNRPIDDGERIRGELWIDVANARDLGGEAEQVIDDLEDGDPVSVSTSYFGDRLPAGEYDGEYRNEAVGNLRPDHLAVLPNKEGRCSIDDGCVAGPQAANALRVAAQADDPGDAGEEPGLRQKIAAGVRDGLSGVGLTYDDPAESGTASIAGNDSSMDRNEQIDFLVKNHGFKRESLDGMGDECLERTYDSFNEEDDGAEVDAEAESGGDEPPADEQPDSTESEVTAESIADELEDRFVTSDELGDAVAEAMAANEQQSEREKLIEEIKQNSDEWTDDQLEGIKSNDALRKIRDDVTETRASANFAGQRGASASATDDPADSFPDLSVGANLEGDD